MSTAITPSLAIASSVVVSVIKSSPQLSVPRAGRSPYTVGRCSRPVARSTTTSGVMSSPMPSARSTEPAIPTTNTVSTPCSRMASAVRGGVRHADLGEHRGDRQPSGGAAIDPAVRAFARTVVGEGEPAHDRVELRPHRRQDPDVGDPSQCRVACHQWKCCMARVRRLSRSGPGSSGRGRRRGRPRRGRRPRACRWWSWASRT